MARWKKLNPSKSALHRREWDKTPNGISYRKKHAEYMREYRKKKGDKMRQKQREYYQKARIEALEYYGGKPPKCAECGESRIACLSIDHIDNNGAEHRREITKEYGYKLGGNQILMWLKKNNYPEGFQILCYNCNIIKEMSRRQISLHNEN